MEPKSASGAPWEGEISLGKSPGGPPELHHEFFFGSGGLRERFGSPPILEPFWLDFRAFFGAFLKRF